MTDASDHAGVEVRAVVGKGRGLFATTPFTPGERIRERIVVREITAQQPLSPGDNPDHATRVDGRALLVGSPDCYQSLLRPERLSWL